MKTKFKDVLNEAYKKQKIETVVKKIAKATDQNDHNEALMILAKQLNSSTYIEAMEGVMKIHHAEMSMPSEIIKYRTYVMKQLLIKAKRVYSKEDFALINGAF